MVQPAIHCFMSMSVCDKDFLILFSNQLDSAVCHIITFFNASAISRMIESIILLLCLSIVVSCRMSSSISIYAPSRYFPFTVEVSGIKENELA